MRDNPLTDAARPLKERVRRALSAGGPLARGDSQFCERPSQLALAEQIVDTLEEDAGTLVAEAGTGTGKTFAYLTPALLSGRTVVITTAGRALQEQIFRKDLPELMKLYGLNCETAMLKGRANYLCKRRMQLSESEGQFPHPEDFKKFRLIKRFDMLTKTGDIAELTEIGERDPIWHYATSTRETCPGFDKCECGNECWLKRARDAARNAQVVVVNHHLYLADKAGLGQKSEIGLLPKAEVTVVDEAHQMSSIATVFFGETVSTREIEAAAYDLCTFATEKVRDAASWSSIRDSVREAVQRLAEKLKAMHWEDGLKKAIDELPLFPMLVPELLRLRAAMRTLTLALASAGGRDEELDMRAQAWGELCTLFDDWKPYMVVPEGFEATVDVKPEANPQSALFEEAPEPAAELPAEEEESVAAELSRTPFVRWIEVFRGHVRFTKSPLSISGPFRALRESAGGAWVLTSATLATGGTFTHFVGNLGLDPEKTKTFLCESPFNYWEQGCFYLPEMPAPANNTDVHTQNVVEAAWPLIDAAQGRTFLLCTSLAAVERAAALLSAKLAANGRDYPLFIQNSAPKGALLEAFRASGHGILIGSMSFWEGVDVRGDALSLVVIDKLPFAPPDDPISAGRSKYLKSVGRSPFMDMVLPEAVIALKQGAGRLIRSEKDRGMFMLCDTRVVDKGYGGIVLKSLPEFFRTRRKEKALQFFLNREAYFAGLYQ